MARQIVVVPFQDDWEQIYKKEAEKLSGILRQTLCAIHHIGSTSVPGLPAKPTIDILAEVASLQTVDERNDAFRRLGYLPYGEYGIKGRRYFCKTDAEGNHLVHIHIFKEGSEDAVRHLAFRDYLATHQQDAAFYGRIKQQLAESFPYDRASYQKGKEAAVRKIEERALQWWYE